MQDKKCRSGGIGRRAGFRCLWSQDRVGSSPISCIVFFALRIKNWSGGPIRITLPGMMQKLPGRVFLFLCGEDVQTGKENRRISDSVKLFKIIAIIHIFHKIKKIKIFSKKVLTFLRKTVIIYLVKRTTAKTTKKCRSGGIGRRAGFRCLWSQDRVGSSPISCIIFLLCVSRIGPVDQFGLP